jgi:cytochrome c553
VEGSEREPLGQRIVEIPDNLEQFESRDPRSTFTAYAPVGSLAKGEALVTTGGPGKTLACAPCHGPDLRGLGPLPSIAGRSPSYMFRQLYDFGHGHRTGEWSPLMAQVVSNLDQDDMLAIVAYLASLDPWGLTPKYLTKASGFFERALALDLDNVDALVGMAQADVETAVTFLTEDRLSI